MRAGDLLEKPVVDEIGGYLGRVHDLRLIRDGPGGPSGRTAYTLNGLAVGKAAVGTRLGFVRGGTRGPLPFRWLFALLGKNAVYIPWSAVSRLEAGRIVVRTSQEPFHKLA